jgi:hypothetical protein
MNPTDTPRQRVGMNRPGCAVFCSALIYPGVGQLLQRRWIAAAVFLASFSVALAVFLARAQQFLAAYYQMAEHFFEMPETSALPALTALLGPCALALAIYFANLVDVWIAARRMVRPPSVPRG